ncbi:glycosyltransferase family 4 protein [Flavobacterium sp.]|uniref:glycosyltransferase family 4 protein n=1 Tax=Flavobacterium sp. TaxID=239 RepID=UPI002631F256|nr:glycosyltransferase family 4 protein [Flavobacterium sp.]MDG2431249.1 glycosyltransferase family 4 protein [Flavobacterium sp.]
MQKVKIIRTATIAMSLDFLLKGQLSFLNNHYEVVAVSGADTHLENVANREGVRTVAIPMQRAIRPFHDMISLWKLYQLFRTEKPQIVHSITPKAGLLSMLAAYFAGVPIRVHTFTGLIFPSKVGSMQKLLIFMDKLLCKCATHVYPEGQGVKNDLVYYKITSKPLKFLANGNINGIDTDYFNSQEVSFNQIQELKNSIGIHTADFVFIFVGRLVTDKGINELVAAFDQLSKIKSNVKLLLVGPKESDLDPLLSSTLETLQSNRSIIEVGFQPDVRSYYAIANAFVFPSYREGFPNVVLQAGAMGLPTIVTDISGCNEIIKNGKNGLVIPVKNEKAILEAMKQMIEDTILRNKLQERIRPIIVSHYSQQFVWDAALEEYEVIVKDIKIN